MTPALDDTIAAIASAPGGAARGIVRLSGPDAAQCVQDVFHPEQESAECSTRHAVAREGHVLPDGWHTAAPATLLTWPEGRSYTGQTMAELHTFGSPPLLDALVDSLCRRGARLAGPGEFTMRAFLAGRLDLAQAEAVLGVIEAERPEQLDAALSQLAGGLSGPLGRLRDELVDLLAHLEAGFEFAEEDIETLPSSELIQRLGRATVELHAVEDRMQRRGLASCTTVVLVGLPNTGKSTLFNALTGGNALVDAQPGTTRDYLSGEIDLDGIRCRLLDTAGRMPEAEGDSLAAAAERMAAREGGTAPISLLCLDAGRRLHPWEQQHIDQPADAHRLIVLTKCDQTRRTDYTGPAIETSAQSGRGLDAMRTALREAISDLHATAADVVTATAARTRESIAAALAAIGRATELAVAGGGEELLAAELRLALDELGKVVGAVYTDDVLDRIFSRFCIGK